MDAVCLTMLSLFWGTYTVPQGYLPNPLASQLSPFPSPSQVADKIKFLDAHKWWLESRLAMNEEHWLRLEGWRREVEYCQSAWLELKTAQDVDCTIDWRRQSLDSLKCRVGEENFRKGIMPPDLWLVHFRRMDP